MGQYWKLVNLDKREFVEPHKLGCGLKLWEQIANHPGTGVAMQILCADMPEPRGGGDLDLDVNWHGPERGDMGGAGPMPEEYPAIASRTIGRWVGDRVALIGDYAEEGDKCGWDRATGEPVYNLCHEWSGRPGDEAPIGAFKDISGDVCAVIEHELRGKFVGDGWRDFDDHRSRVHRAWWDLMQAFPWGEDEEINGGDVVDRINALREMVERGAQ